MGKGWNPGQQIHGDPSRHELKRAKSRSSDDDDDGDGVEQQQETRGMGETEREREAVWQNALMA